MIKKYHLISILPIYKKVLKKYSVFNFFRKNKHIADYQLLSTTREIYKSFDCSPTRNIKGIFLNISNAFQKIWHESFFFEIIKKIT